MYAPDYSELRQQFEAVTPRETDAAADQSRSSALGRTTALSAIHYGTTHHDAPSTIAVHRLGPELADSLCGRALVESAQKLAETQFGPVPDHLFDLHNLQSTLFVACQGSDVVGMMSVESVMRDDPFHHRNDEVLRLTVGELDGFVGPMAFRDYFVVDRDSRGLGIGSKLSDETLKYIFGDGRFDVQMGVTTLTDRQWGRAQQIVLDQGAVFVAVVQGMWRDDPMHEEELENCPACSGACNCIGLAYVNTSEDSPYEIAPRDIIPQLRFEASEVRRERPVSLDSIVGGRKL